MIFYCVNFVLYFILICGSLAQNLSPDATSCDDRKKCGNSIEVIIENIDFGVNRTSIAHLENCIEKEIIKFTQNEKKIDIITLLNKDPENNISRNIEEHCAKNTKHIKISFTKCEESHSLNNTNEDYETQNKTALQNDLLSENNFFNICDLLDNQTSTTKQKATTTTSRITKETKTTRMATPRPEKTSSSSIEKNNTNHMYNFGVFCIILSLILVSIAVFLHMKNINQEPKTMQNSNPLKVNIPKPVKPLTAEEIEHALNNHIKLKKGDDLLENITKIVEMTDDVRKEFRTLGLVVKDHVSKTLPTSEEGRLPHHKIRNRYNDIIPYDSNRVILEKPIGDPQSTYINASPMKFSSTEQTFISAQAPRPNTFGGFWQMILENKVTTVIMITDLVEGARRKAEKYWPDADDFPEIPLENDIKVKYVSDWKQDTYHHRTIIVTDPNNGEEHKIDHLKAGTWPDMQAPNDPNILLDLLYKTQELATARKGPILVHCSAGVGRTGTFIALYKLTEELANDDVEELDLFLTTLEMRRQRCFMIQKSEQYLYVFKCLQKYVADQKTVKKDVEEIKQENGEPNEDIKELSDDPYDVKKHVEEIKGKSDQPDDVKIDVDEIKEQSDEPDKEINKQSDQPDDVKLDVEEIKGQSDEPDEEIKEQNDGPNEEQNDGPDEEIEEERDGTDDVEKDVMEAKEKSDQPDDVKIDVDEMKE